MNGSPTRNAARRRTWFGISFMLLVLVGCSNEGTAPVTPSDMQLANQMCNAVSNQGVLSVRHKQNSGRWPEGPHIEVQLTIKCDNNVTIEYTKRY